MSREADIHDRLLNHEYYIDDDGRPIVLDVTATDALLAEAAAEIRRLHDIIHGDGSWDGQAATEE